VVPCRAVLQQCKMLLHSNVSKCCVITQTTRTQLPAGLCRSISSGRLLLLGSA
jgi:hypothetical protein